MLETIKRILAMAGKYRHKITIGIIISLLHSFFSAMDLYRIMYSALSLLYFLLLLLCCFKKGGFYDNI